MTKAKLTGEWGKGSGSGIDEGYQHDMNEDEGARSRPRFEIDGAEGRDGTRCGSLTRQTRTARRTCR